MSDKASDPVSDCIRLHCFPNIASETPDGGRRPPALKDSFQRSYRRTGAPVAGSVAVSSGIKHFRPAGGHPPLEQVEADAYRRGVADGKREGLAEGEKRGFDCANAKMRGLLNSLHQALAQVQNLHRQVARELENEVVELALAIARKVVCREAATDRDIVLAVAREALQQFENPGKITIKLNPTDLQAAEETGSGFSSLTENMKEVHLEADASIGPGGCVIETDCGAIDARLDRQLQVVEAAFRHEMQRPGDRS